MPQGQDRRSISNIFTMISYLTLSLNRRRRFRSRELFIASLAVLSVFFPVSEVRGDVEISISEDVSGVVISWEGSINTSGLTSDGPFGGLSTGIEPAIGGFDGEGNSSISPNSSTFLFSEAVGVFSFGSGNSTGAGNVPPESSFAIEAGDDELALPLNYVSDATFTGAFSFPGETISSLGIDLDPFQVVLPDGAGTVSFFPPVTDPNVVIRTQLKVKINKLKKKARKLKTAAQKKRFKKKIKKLKKRLQSL